MIRSAFALVAAGLLLAGCAASPSETAELENVTENQYRAAFEEFAACMDDAGYPVIVRDDSGTVIQYSIPGTVVGTPTESDCYNPFQPIDTAWQIANEDTSEGALHVRVCLEEHGIDPVGTASGDWQQVIDNELKDECGGPW